MEQKERKSGYYNTIGFGDPWKRITSYNSETKVFTIEEGPNKGKTAIESEFEYISEDKFPVPYRKPIIREEAIDKLVEIDVSEISEEDAKNPMYVEDTIVNAQSAYKGMTDRELEIELKEKLKVEYEIRK